MFKEMTTKKKVIIAIVIVAVIALIIFLVMRSKKKKKEAAAKLAESNFAQVNTPAPVQQKPKMQIVPDEDAVVPAQPEKPLSVKEVVPEKAPTTSNAPGTLGVPSAGAGTNNGKGPVKKPAGNAGSALPSEFMQDANNPG